VSRLVIPASVLDEARARMEDAGALGCEATGMIVAGPDRVARHTVFPDQLASRPNPATEPPERRGVHWVEVTERGKAELAMALGSDETYAARIHSHPGAAFHSATDDGNPGLRYEGALSIVVPYFGLGLRAGLRACGVFVRRGRCWLALPPGPEREQVIHVTP
jgi:hypothetical protein